MLVNAISLAASLSTKSAPGSSKVMTAGKSIVGFSFVDGRSRVFLETVCDGHEAAESYMIPHGLGVTAKLCSRLDEQFVLSFSKDKRILFRSPTGNFSIKTAEPSHADLMEFAPWAAKSNALATLDLPHCLGDHLALLAPIADDSIRSSISILPGVDRLAAWDSSHVAFLKGEYQSEMEVQLPGIAVKAVRALGTPVSGSVLERNGGHYVELRFNKDGWITTVSYSQPSPERLLGSKINDLLDSASRTGKITIEADEMIAGLKRCELTGADTFAWVEPSEQRMRITSHGEMLTVEETINANIDVDMPDASLALDPGLMIEILNASTMGLKGVALDLSLNDILSPSQLITGRGILMLKKTIK